jgi:hypothetical protein
MVASSVSKSSINRKGIIMKNQLSLFPTYPNRDEIVRDVWSKARPDPDFREVMKSVPLWNMNNETLARCDERISFLIHHNKNLSENSKKTLEAIARHRIHEVQEYLDQLIILAARDNGKIFQEVYQHLVENKMIEAFVALLEEKWVASKKLSYEFIAVSFARDVMFLKKRIKQEQIARLKIK